MERFRLDGEVLPSWWTEGVRDIRKKWKGRGSIGGTDTLRDGSKKKYEMRHGKETAQKVNKNKLTLKAAQYSPNIPNAFQQALSLSAQLSPLGIGLEFTLDDVELGRRLLLIATKLLDPPRLVPAASKFAFI